MLPDFPPNANPEEWKKTKKKKYILVQNKDLTDALDALIENHNILNGEYKARESHLEKNEPFSETIMIFFKKHNELINITQNDIRIIKKKNRLVPFFGEYCDTLVSTLGKYALDLGNFFKTIEVKNNKNTNRAGTTPGEKAGEAPKSHHQVPAGKTQHPVIEHIQRRVRERSVLVLDSQENLCHRQLKGQYKVLSEKTLSLFGVMKLKEHYDDMNKACKNYQKTLNETIVMIHKHNTPRLTQHLINELPVDNLEHFFEKYTPKIDELVNFCKKGIPQTATDKEKAYLLQVQFWIRMRPFHDFLEKFKILLEFPGRVPVIPPRRRTE